MSSLKLVLEVSKDILDAVTRGTASRVLDPAMGKQPFSLPLSQFISLGKRSD
jgi:hypothetical protein